MAGGKKGRNRDPIQRTDQHDRSLERALSPSSEWQLVKPQWLAQPLLSSLCLSVYLMYYSDRLLSASSFSLTSSSVYLVLSSSITLYFSPFFPFCPCSHFVSLLLVSHILAILCLLHGSSFSFSSSPLQQHSHSAVTWIWGKALKCWKMRGNSKPVFPPVNNACCVSLC